MHKLPYIKEDACPECVAAFSFWSTDAHVGDTYVCSRCKSHHLVKSVSPVTLVHTTPLEAMPRVLG